MTSVIVLHHLFFFASRRRHTRWPRDWSSDVCSSDLRISAKFGCVINMYNKPAVTDPASPEIILSSLSNGFPKMRIPRADIESSQEKEVSISFRKISQA